MPTLPSARWLSGGEWAVLLFILLYSFIPTFGGMFRVLELAGGPAIVPANPRALADPLPIVLHIVSSAVFCLGGAVQFLPSVRQYHPRLHRAVGRAAAIAGVLSAATGLWMTVRFSFPADLQGALLYWVRVFLSLLMIALIVGAMAAVRRRQFDTHAAAMVRAYAIGQGASTQAVLGIAWIVVIGTEPAGAVRDAFMVFAWALNLLIAELLIGRLARPVRWSMP